MITHPLQQISFLASNQAYVIEASAGTGKTWTIERLYIKALLEASLIDDQDIPISVENILVVTFTNDATDELKQRISDQIKTTINIMIYLARDGKDLVDDLFIEYLKKRQTNYSIHKDITLLTRALQNFDSAAIFTIHGFCNRILQDYQFECRSSANFELIPTKQTLIQDLVRDFIRKNIFTNPLFIDNLTVVTGNLDSLFVSMNYEHDLIQRITDKLPKDLLAINNYQYQLKYEFIVESSLKLLNNPTLTEDEKRQAKAQLLSSIADYVLHHYALLANQLNQISYDELIQIVADSVSNSTVLADKLYQKYPLAFIDEFQDTDNLQWQIFSHIYQLDKVKRGNVVVVGDPKQAIYRFRGADIDTYIEARQQIANSLELVHNYRSCPEIMNFVNMLFALPNQNVDTSNSFLGNGIDYVHIEACGKSKLQLPSSSELTKITHDLGFNQQFYDDPVHLVAITGNSASERKQKLLYALAFDILSLLALDGSLKGKIAIIVTKNREANEVVNFLRKFGIKAAELKLGSIFATSTAQDLYKILLAAQDLSIRKNMLIALGTRIINLTLAKLSLNNSNDGKVLERWYKRIFEYNQIWQKRGIISVIYRLLEDLISEHAGEIQVFSNRELANLNQLAELLNKQMNKCHNQAELMYWFKNKLDGANDLLANDLDGSNDELVRLDNDDEQIIITTQHKSKGLEYEVLFCPFFKSSITLDGQYDFNYRRPFFANYRENMVAKSVMLMDKALGEMVVSNDNKEIHRLNYVALTRAKSRIYIYLKQPTISKSTGKYFALQRPDKIAELFGYVADDPSDVSHQLFNYPQFFGPNPEQAIKRKSELPGVAVYQRNNVTLELLTNLGQLQTDNMNKELTNLQTVSSAFDPRTNFARQSYSAITSHGSEDSMSDWFVKNESGFSELTYAFSILNDTDFKGAVFGTLFHSLCEQYPFSEETLVSELKRANVKINDHDYLPQLMQMLDITFNYPLYQSSTLNNISNKIHELEFNLLVADDVSLATELSIILERHLGSDHPFTQASKTLSNIDKGFLVGFIDLFFALDGKYWVLDYKTNKLNDYTQATIIDQTNSLVDSMSEHHYYLQYLLYLVAIKRHLEVRLNISDATDLIGGAIYFYVRGAFTTQVAPYDGIFLDNQCQILVKDIDALLRGSK